MPTKMDNQSESKKTEHHLRCACQSGPADSVCPSVLLDQHTHLCLADLLVLLVQTWLAPRPPISAYTVAQLR